MSDASDTLTEVFCDVVEKLAFMFGEPADTADLDIQGQQCLLAAMNFSGELTGSMALALPQAMCDEIAANVMGLEPDDLADEHRADAVKEALNVTCGNVLTALAGEKPIFDLTIPQVAAIDPAAWAKLAADEEVVGVEVDDYAVLLKISLKDG